MLRILGRYLWVACIVLLFAVGAAAAAEETAKPSGAGKHPAKEKKAASGKKKTAKSDAAKGKGKSKVKPKAKSTQPAATAEVEPKSQALVKELRHWSNPDYTRIAITLDKESHFEYHRLKEDQGAKLPPRLYLDISGARLSSEAKDMTIADGLLKMARVAQFRPNTVRVVLDMESIKDFKVFTFSDPFRILIDVRGDRRPEFTAVKERIEAAPPQPALALEPSMDKGAKKTPPLPIGKIRRVVVDPGHGGHDPGAIGSGGTQEKDVVLSIGGKLARKLREELGLDVVMTRSTDVFLELQERTAIANKVGADLFLSIHANAAPNRSAAGIETYYLSLAKTEKAAQLAAKENGTSLEKVSTLQAVLFDLMANYKINDSAHLAETVQKELCRKLEARWPVRSLGVKQGPFYVLVGATMPSILVETAFLSNDREEQRLKDEEYQELAANGIADGVRAYISGVK